MGPPTTADSKPPPPAIAADGTAGTTTASAMASGDPSTPGAQQQQQQEPVFQPQSLQDIAVRCLSRHLEVFGRARYRCVFQAIKNDDDSFNTVVAQAAYDHTRGPTELDPHRIQTQ